MGWVVSYGLGQGEGRVIILGIYDDNAIIEREGAEENNGDGRCEELSCGG